MAIFGLILSIISLIVSTTVSYKIYKTSKDMDVILDNMIKNNEIIRNTIEDNMEE